MKVALVTGSSSGIGKAVVEAFCRQGWKVIGFSRHEGVDVTDEKAVSTALARVLADYGRIDALVNNAGVGAFGAFENISEAELRHSFEVNFFAAVRLAEKVIPIMRRQGGGRIISVASAAAMFPLPFQSIYSSTKAALLVWSRALAGEVSRFGIRVTAVCPGDLKTGFTAARIASFAGDDVYAGAIERALKRAATAESQGGDPAKVADLIVRIATIGRPPLVVIPGFGYKLLDFFARLLPRTWVSSLIVRFYT